MEHHFILRFSKDFLDPINLHESKIERIDNDKLKLIYKDKIYPGISIQLPCVVESQKTLDSKQFYKICDVSTLIVIYPNENYDFEDEKRKLSISGLSPPLKFVKGRRFKKKSVKYQDLEEIESKVQEILERDKKANKIEIIKEENSDEISNLIVEIEEGVSKGDAKGEDKDRGDAKDKDNEDIKENETILNIKNQIKEQEKRVEDALNPILKQRFQNVLNDLKKKLEEYQEKK
ncbi:Transcription initiation factor TFIID subunit 7 [Nosema bombycis CQ1]|uniref:Transcription initiation factor TFIID subunit 7 n=1 Tax=Nosema bombycis (strain CQ1 / CVCC 102059) TaxID=578461 RepID=R0KU54_NOSB1|nr:Transcription initiation factor TFIID subunit 7 [Nosema bombycis CQ1]|eukprot:EOB13757.1 Transcription initiation factor TFIID subunit 7 [Nosema bombycis CQ1]